MFKIIDYTKEVLSGRTIYRTLLNLLVKEHCRGLNGEILDLAGGGNASYYKYLPTNAKIIRTNCRTGKGIDKVVDFNQALPFADDSIDNILFFNAIYIVKDRVKLLKELKRILKNGGKLFIVSPFIANEMPEPRDYCRLTYEGLEKELQEADFPDIRIIRFGERFSSVVYLLDPIWLFSFIRIIIYSLALFFDRVIPRKIKEKHPVPLGYFCVINK